MRPLHAIVASTLIGLLCTHMALAADLMDSPTCRQAMTALQQEEQRVGAASAADRSPWQALRQAAARACLGAAAAASAPRRGSVTAPMRVPPVTVGGPAASALLPKAPGSPSPRPEGPRAITSCDAAGCWTSDGGRVQRMGPDLVGPRGVCTVQGDVIRCP